MKILIPLFCKRISEGPELQFEEIIGMLNIIASVSTFGKPSYRDESINKSLDNGAVHKYNEKVISWKKESSCYKVITDKNEYLTEKIIFSSGAWIKNLLPSLNLPLRIERQVAQVVFFSF